MGSALLNLAKVVWENSRRYKELKKHHDTHCVCFIDLGCNCDCKPPDKSLKDLPELSGDEKKLLTDMDFGEWPLAKKIVKQ